MINHAVWAYKHFVCVFTEVGDKPIQESKFPEALQQKYTQKVYVGKNWLLVALRVDKASEPLICINKHYETFVRKLVNLQIAFI